MDRKEIQEYFDNNVDNVRLAEVNNPMLAGLKVMDNLKGGQVDCLFNKTDSGYELSVKCFKSTLDAVKLMMSFNWIYEDGYWIYYE